MEGRRLKQEANSHRKDFHKQALLVFPTFDSRVEMNGSLM